MLAHVQSRFTGALNIEMGQAEGEGHLTIAKSFLQLYGIATKDLSRSGNAACAYTVGQQRARRIMIAIADYPQLKLIAWNRRPDDWLDERDALSLYEANWRFIDEAALTDAERELIAHLRITYGCGVLNV